ncbi:MAG: nucleotidyltransferase family protein [Candidatus Gottesmanbacteria bacterium]|nr:nucleotidyltransferase family protein [Candidatus Gottesmanbacteria bacterium]
MTKYDKVARRKDRLTISLPKDVLSALTGTIDGKEIRNMSHAIEHFLRRSLKPSITNAVILAGAPAKTTPHPSLTAIEGRSLLDITLEHLAGAGFKNVYMLAAANRDTLRASVGQHTYGMNIHWIDEPKPMGTGGALKLLEGTIREPFLVLHGDVLTNIPLQSFIDFHLYEQTLVTIAVKPRHSESAYGQATLQGNRITTFSEHDRGIGISIVNTGVYMVNPAVFSYLPAGKPSTIEADVFPKLAAAGELSAFFFQGMWFDITNHKNMREVIRRYRLERR